MAAQAAFSRKGVAVLIMPVDVSKAAAPDEPEFAVHRAAPVIRPSDAELDRIATALNAGNRIAIYGGSGCAKAHDQVVALAERLKAPVARTSRAKDFLALPAEGPTTSEVTMHERPCTSHSAVAS